MTQEFTGREKAAGLSLEASRGVAELTVSRWFKSVTNSILEMAKKVNEDSSYGKLEDSGGARIVNKWVEGNIAGVATADSIGFILANLYGTINSEADGAAYKHTFTLLQNISHPSLSVFIKNGAVDQKVYAGGMVDKLELSATIDNYVRFSADFKAKSGSADVNVVTAEEEFDWIGKDITIKFADDESGLAAAEETKIKNVKVTWSQDLIVDHVLGQYEPEDIYNPKHAIEFSIVRNYNDTTFKTLYLSDSAKVCQIKIEGSQDLGGGKKPTLTVTLYNVQCMSRKEDGGVDDLVTEPLDFKAFYNSTELKMSEIELINAVESYQAGS